LACRFSTKVSRPIHCEARGFPGKLNEVARNMKDEEGDEAVLLFDAIEQAVEVGTFRWAIILHC